MGGDLGSTTVDKVVDYFVGVGWMGAAKEGNGRRWLELCAGGC